MATKVIISGGGTGGHIFPALSIAKALQRKCPDIDILFVGALGRMEMKRIPDAGYKIIGLPISGFHRKLTFKNFQVLYQLLYSLVKAHKIVKDFKPQVAVGVGGYASAPLLKTASLMGVPTLLQEQNSYAGMTNKWLAKQAKTICVAYQGMEKFFPKDKLLLTGNPVRPEIENNIITKEEACQYFGLNPDKKVILSLGGSLGARTINKAMASLCRQISSDIQVIWQTGEYYYQDIINNQDCKSPNILIKDFIKRMDMAYAAADVIISRAGAGTISELCLVGKSCVLIPSPNVAEDHQTHNALALADVSAAIMVTDKNVERDLFQIVVDLINDTDKMKTMSSNILKLAERQSADRIADEVLKLI